MIKKVVPHLVYLTIIVLVIFFRHEETWIFDHPDMFASALYYQPRLESFAEIVASNRSEINRIKRECISDSGEVLHDDCPLLAEWVMAAEKMPYLNPYVSVLIDHGANVEAAKGWLIAHDEDRSVLLLEKINSSACGEEH